MNYLVFSYHRVSFTGYELFDTFCHLKSVDRYVYGSVFFVLLSSFGILVFRSSLWVWFSILYSSIIVWYSYHQIIMSVVQYFFIFHHRWVFLSFDFVRSLCLWFRILLSNIFFWFEVILLCEMLTIILLLVILVTFYLLIFSLSHYSSVSDAEQYSTLSSMRGWCKIVTMVSAIFTNIFAILYTLPAVPLCTLYISLYSLVYLCVCMFIFHILVFTLYLEMYLWSILPFFHLYDICHVLSHLWGFLDLVS